MKVTVAMIWLMMKGIITMKMEESMGFWKNDKQHSIEKEQWIKSSKLIVSL
jgi:hypothetical protein